MDPDYSLVLEIIRESESVSAGMERIIARCNERLPHSVWAELSGLSYEEDVEKLRDWLVNVHAADPPGLKVAILYFGLRECPNLEDDECDISMDIALCGIAEEPVNKVALPPHTEVNYVPKEPYADSAILSKIRKVLDSIIIEPEDEDEDDMENGPVDELGTEMLGLTYANLAMREVCRQIQPELLLGDRESRHIAVGWDEGDIIIMGEVSKGQFRVLANG